MSAHASRRVNRPYVLRDCDFVSAASGRLGFLPYLSMVFPLSVDTHTIDYRRDQWVSFAALSSIAGQQL